MDVYCVMGAEPTEATKMAILNANYMAQVKGIFSRALRVIRAW